MKFAISLPDELLNGSVADSAMKEFCADLKKLAESGDYRGPEKLGIISVMAVDKGNYGRMLWDEHVTFHFDRKTAAVYVFTDIRKFRAEDSVGKIRLVAEAVSRAMKMLAAEYPSFNLSLFEEDYKNLLLQNAEKYESIAVRTRRGRPRKNSKGQGIICQ